MPFQCLGDDSMSLLLRLINMMNYINRYFPTFYYEMFQTYTKVEGNLQ